jgi:ssDNA-binding replication factor A large subunit
MPELNITEIKDLKERESATITGRIAEVREHKPITLKDGTKHLIQECVLQDGSGEVILNLWDTQVDTLQVGDNIRIESGWVTMFKTSYRFATGKFGKLIKL